MNNYTHTLSILLVAIFVGTPACGESDGDAESTSSGGTGSAAASCVDECREYYDCRFSLCLLQGGASCSTQRIEGQASCDVLTEDDCTASLLSTYGSCEGSDDGSSGESSSGDGSSSSEGDGSSSSEGDGSSSSGWAESSSTGGSCLPANSFCDFDFECCSGTCDVDFAFCH